MLADNPQCAECAKYLYCMKCQRYAVKIPKEYATGEKKCKDYKKK